MTGRNLANAALAVLAIVLFAACSPNEPGLPNNVEQVADGVYLFTSGSHRSLFLIGDDGVIVTDPTDMQSAIEYREAIAKLTDQPVKIVVYSHYHWDRILGARIFAAEGAQVIAQAQCEERFMENPNSGVVLPDVTFERQHKVSVGDVSLEMHHFGPAHGDCLSAFLVQPARLLQVVDLVEPPAASFPDNPNVPYIKPHNLREYFTDLTQLAIDEGITGVLAAHGEPAVGPASIVADQARFWNAIYDTVEQAREQGHVGIDSFVKIDKVDVSQFEQYDGFDKAALPIIMRRIVAYYDMGR